MIINNLVFTLPQAQENISLTAATLIYSPLDFWRYTTNITKSYFINYSCYIDPRNHILKYSLYSKESHNLLRFVVFLTTELLLNLKPNKIDHPI